MQINLTKSMRTHTERCSFQLTFSNGGNANDPHMLRCSSRYNGQCAEIFKAFFMPLGG